ncbi:hypothetical protein AB0912_00250 [Streptomyces sp. NPDC007084]|uniref:hypothetical protein n=1 Tax=Streptomyces sp. NPDC007084 TaxID=3154313 RepID=UPI0034558286
MKHIVITPKDMERLRPALCAWAEANGIDPKGVAVEPITVCFAVDSPKIEYVAFVLDEEGRRQVDPHGTDRVLTARHVTRLVSPLEAHGLDAGQFGS